MSTSDDLKAAFAGESQANRLYLAFAKQAQQDGLAQVAKLFRAAAEAETVHAHAHLRAMNGVKTTAENVQTAIDGEGYEFQTMYPEFLARAQAEGHKAAVRSFQNALAVEKIHHALYGQAKAAVAGGKDLPASKIWVCKVCGNTVAGESAPHECPVCGSREQFFEVA